jgi:hypothetical protein
MNLPRSLDFLQGEPEPVRPDAQSAKPDPADVLPHAVAERLMALDGVDGAWVERDAQGGRVVVLHYSKPGRPTHLPATAHGLPVRVVGGEPIRAGL